MDGFIYILWSEKTNKYYIGSSTNPQLRLDKQHNEGFVKATKSGVPWKLVFQQKCQDLHDARTIEYKLKRLKSRIIIEKIIREGKCRLVR